MLLDLLPQLLFLLCFTPVALLWGGCCCQPSCTFFTDNFTRADSDDPGDYTEVSGDWDISSNALVTSSSNGVLVADTGHPDGEPNIKVSLTVRGSASGDIAQIILDRADANNYWFAEVKFGTGSYIKIFQKSGGSDSEKASFSIGLATSTSYVFCASIANSDHIFATINSIGVSATGTFSNASWGLGTGALTGTVTFTSLTASRTNETCKSCSPVCSLCTDTIGISYAKIVVSGSADGGFCTNCSNLDGTWYAEFCRNVCSPGGCACVYGSTPTTVTNIGSPYVVRHNLLTSTTDSIGALSVRGGCAGNFYCGRFASPDFNCTEWQNTVFSYVNENSGCCDMTSATIEVTSYL